MYKIRNRARQEIPVDIVAKDGKQVRKFLSDMQIVYSKEITKTMENLEDRGLLRVVEVDDEDVDEEKIEVTEEDVVESFDNE